MLHGKRLEMPPRSGCIETEHGNFYLRKRLGTDRQENLNEQCSSRKTVEECASRRAAVIFVKSKSVLVFSCIYISYAIKNQNGLAFRYIYSLIFCIYIQLKVNAFMKVPPECYNSHVCTGPSAECASMEVFYMMGLIHRLLIMYVSGWKVDSRPQLAG